METTNGSKADLQNGNITTRAGAQTGTQDSFPLEILQRVPVALALFEQEHFRLKFINEKALELFAQDKDTVLEKTLLDFSPELIRPLVPMMQQVFQTGKPCIKRSLQLCFLKKDHVYAGFFDVQVLPFEIPGSGSMVMLTLSEVSTSILEQKKAEERERKLSQQLQLITDAMPVFISYVDPAGEIKFINKAFEAWAGFTSKQLAGKQLKAIFGKEAEQKFLQQTEAVLEGNLTEFRLSVSVRNEHRQIEVHLLPHLNRSKEVHGFYALFIDITDRKQVVRTARPADGKFNGLRRSVTEMNETIKEIQSKLEVAKMKIKRAGESNKNINMLLQKWTSNLQASESIAVKVKDAIARWLDNRAA